jgi:hypothetical protein
MTVPKIIDHLNAVSEISAASPESITYIPDHMSAENIRHFVRLLGIEGELKAAAALDGVVDMKIISEALAKTKLSIADRIKAKIILTGSGFAKGAR